MNNILRIQRWMKKNNIDIYIINRTDEFLSEYIAPYAERLKWISNFSGSAGRIIVTKKKSYIFVDGRYTVQAHEEINKKYFIIKHLNDYWSFIKTKIKKKEIIGIDPNLHTVSEIQIVRKLSKEKQFKIHFFTTNPIDNLWENQPKPPKSKVFLHDLKYSGKTIKTKFKNIKLYLKNEKIDYFLLSSTDSIAWLLNIRGNDIPFTPITLCYLIIPTKGKMQLFIKSNKIKNIRNKLKNYIIFNEINEIYKYFKVIDKQKIVGLDPNKTPSIFEDICLQNKINLKFANDPCVYWKAQKNNTEITGAKKANIRDGLSVTKFLYWIKNNKNISKLDEIKASKKLYNLRKKNSLFFSLSFETISAFGKNSALPHYRITKKTNLFFKKNNIYLVDSGAQYYDGTTDITRTIILGKASKNQKDKFTRVLKGHIAIATAKFPINTKGSQIDYMARNSLIEIGCDYDHGTGHGVGSFLAVHEGPQRIAKKHENEGKIIPGMIISNEPGYYSKNNYGIRIENLIISKQISKNLQGFETISYAPIDKDLIDVSLLNIEEIEWINNYHKKVYKKYNTELSYSERRWLKKATEPI